MAHAWRAFPPAIAPPLGPELRSGERSIAGNRAEVSSSAVAFAIVSERSAFDALEPEWNDLFRRAGRDTQVFQAFNWNWHWANHYLDPNSRRRSLAILTVRRHGRLVMLWPLVMERRAGLAVLRWMGEPVSQYGDVLCETMPDALEILRMSWRYLAGTLGADAVVLRKVRADSVVAPLLRELGLPCTAVDRAPCLDLASAKNFAAYEQRYSPKARKNRRRLMRRLEERGGTTIDRLTGGNRARAAALEAIALKKATLGETGRLAPAMADQRFAAFFADVAEGSVRPAGCGVTVLTCGGNIAGVAIDITCQSRRVAHVIVHDPRLESCSAGTLLLQEWIRRAADDRIATFDLLAPALPYKMD